MPQSFPGAWIYWAAIVQFLSNVSQDHSIAGSYDIGNHLPISCLAGLALFAITMKPQDGRRTVDGSMKFL